MVEVADIRDEKSLLQWLEALPRGTPEQEARARRIAVTVAARTAARVLPHWWEWMLQSGAARPGDFTVFPILRSILTSSVAALVPTDDIRRAAAAARATDAARDALAAVYDAAARAAAADRAALDVYDAADRAVYARLYADAADDRAEGYDAYARFAGRAADAAVAAARAASADAFAEAAAYTTVAARTHASASWDSVQSDLGALGAGRDPGALWPERFPYAETWRRIRATLGEDPVSAFWLWWYQGLLDGTGPVPDHPMLVEIALLPDAVWKDESRALAEINAVRDRYRLRDEALALRNELAALRTAVASAQQRSHNHPPELVETEPELARQVTLVWTDLDEVAKELAKSKPDKSRLRKIGESLLASLQAIVEYCGKVADGYVMAAAKVSGGATGAALVDHFANNGRLWQFAKDLLTHAGGG